MTRTKLGKLAAILLVLTAGLALAQRLDRPAACMQTSEATRLTRAVDDAHADAVDAQVRVQQAERRTTNRERLFALAVATANACWLTGPATWLACGSVSAAAVAAHDAVISAQEDERNAVRAYERALTKASRAEADLAAYVRQRCDSNGGPR